MWSRKPTPVARLAGARAVERRASSSTSVSLVSRVISAARLIRARILPHPHRGRVARRSPRPARSARRRAASAPAAGADPHLAHAPPEVARRRAARRTAPRRRSAACGSSPRRSRRTPCRSRARRTAQPGAAHARRERLGRGADELEVLGGEGLGERERGLEVGRVDERGRRVARRSSSIASSSAGSSLTGAHDRARRRARPGRRGRCSRAPGRPRPTRARRTSRGPGEAVDADVARDQALGLLHVEVARARR